MVLVLVVVSILYSAVKVVKEYERGVIFRLGRVQGGPKGPGLFLLFPFVDSMVKIDLRTITMDVPPQDVSEYQASERLRQAADRLESPTALQLRLFQTMGEIAVNQNSTIILPVPIDLFKPFLESQNETDGPHHATHREEDAERLYEEAVGDISPKQRPPPKTKPLKRHVPEQNPPGVRTPLQAKPEHAVKARRAVLTSAGRRTQRAARGLASNTSG